MLSKLLSFQLKSIVVAKLLGFMLWYNRGGLAPKIDSIYM